MKKIIFLFLSIIFASIFIFSSCGKENSSISPTEEALSSDANKLVEEMAQGDYAGAKKNHDYAFVMNLLTGNKTLKAIWASLAKEYGSYVSVYDYEYEQLEGFDNIIIKVAFENQSIDFKVTYKKDTLKISGLHYLTNADKPSLAGASILESLRA